MDHLSITSQQKESMPSTPTCARLREGRTVFCNPLDTQNVEEIRSNTLNRRQS